MAHIRANDQQRICMLNAGNRRIHQVFLTRAFTPRRAERCSVLTTINVLHTESIHQIFQSLHRFRASQITCNSRDAFWVTLKFFSNDAECFVPRDRYEFTFFAHIRLVQTLTTKTVPDETGFIGNPFFIDGIINDRNNPQHTAIAAVHTDVRTNCVHHVDGFRRLQLPRPRIKRIWFGGQRPNRAQINDISGQLRGQ